MPFYIEVNESAADGVRRLLLEQIDYAVTSLQAPDVDKGVHEARKSMKRIRAVLRLVRGSIKEKVYKRENRFFRDVARTLSGARDSYVLVKTLDALIADFGDQLSEEIAAPIRDHLLEAYREKERELLGEQSAVLEKAVRKLEESKERIESLAFDDRGFAVFADGLQRIYSDGRDEMTHAYETLSVEAFHEWRKSVKYLWHQVEVLTPAWEQVLAPYAEEMHELADYLGDDHDYAVLKEQLLEIPSEVGDGDTIYLLVTLINTRREHLQRSAHTLAQRLYAESPKQFIKRHRTYWKMWQKEAPAV